MVFCLHQFAVAWPVEQGGEARDGLSDTSFERGLPGEGAAIDLIFFLVFGVLACAVFLVLGAVSLLPRLTFHLCEDWTTHEGFISFWCTSVSPSPLCCNTCCTAVAVETGVLAEKVSLGRASEG